MMPWPWIELHNLLPAFLLVCTRVSGIMIMSPVYSSRLLPARLKMMLVLAISAAVFPTVSLTLPQQLSVPMVVAGMVGELMIGLLIGLGLNLIIMAAQMTGIIVGQQAGLALARVFNPNTEIQTTVIGEIFFYTATVLFLLLDGHRVVIRALLDSFQTVPAMTAWVDSSAVELLAMLLMSSLVFAYKMAGPAVLALLISKATIGFLSRTIPQLHILSVGFAIFVCIGMIMSALVLSQLEDVMSLHLDEAIDLIRQVLNIV